MVNNLVSIVIINFNSGKYIFRCLEHLKKQTHKDTEIIIVDNNSTDGSSLKLNKSNGINYFKLTENKGSSFANNYGIKKGNGEFIFILNADVFLDETYIENSLKCFSLNPKIGTVTGKLLSDHNNSIIDTTGITLFKEGTAVERGMGEIDNKQYDNDGYIVGACCACVIYRKEMLDALEYKGQYYSEIYFAFIEDLDLSVLSILLGWKTYYTYTSVGCHVRGGSTKKASEFVQYLSVRNSEIFYLTLLSENKVFKNWHTLLKIIRFFKYYYINKKVYENINSKEYLINNRKEFFKTKLDYSYLEEFQLKSYLFVKVKIFIKKIISIIFITPRFNQ
jgi:GT2 family glycosyltransferase